MYINCHMYTHFSNVLVYFQASARLPDADAEIEDVTPELIEATTVISEQLVMATDREEAPAPLLPLDLNTTNNVVAQVRDNLVTMINTDIIHIMLYMHQT